MKYNWNTTEKQYYETFLYFSNMKRKLMFV